MDIHAAVRKRHAKFHKEGFNHIMLKDLAVSWLKELGAKRIEREVPTGLGYFADVVGYFGLGNTVVIECGNVAPKRMKAHREEFTVVVHLPYCDTPWIFDKEAILNKIEEKLIVRGEI
jgi:hypothetical protein